MNEGYVQTANAFSINQKLREGKLDEMRDNDKSVVKALDSLIQDNQLKKNVLLYRNVRYDFIEATFGIKTSKDINENIKNIKNIKNSGIVSYADKGFTSVSAVKSENVFQGRPAHLEIRAKKGTHAFVTSNREESEIILGREQKMILVDVLNDYGKLKLILETD